MPMSLKVVMLQRRVRLGLMRQGAGAGHLPHIAQGHELLVEGGVGQAGDLPALPGFLELHGQLGAAILRL